MISGRRASVVLRCIAAGLLVWAWDEQPASYFRLLRLAVCGATAFSAFTLSGTCTPQMKAWKWTFAAIAILFNPFLPVRLDRISWLVIDTTTAIILLLSCVLVRPSTPSSSGI